jgi:hypothetical protein
VVGPIQVSMRGRVADITVSASDSFSAVAEAWYSLDAGDWIPILPVDRIADAPRESYRFQTPELEPGEHVVTVRARDRAGNQGAAKAILTGSR